MTPDWTAISAYYRRHNEEILAAGANAWGLDPYQWEFEGGIKRSPATAVNGSSIIGARA